MKSTRNPILRHTFLASAIITLVIIPSALAANTTFDWNLTTGGSLNTPGN